MQVADCRIGDSALRSRCEANRVTPSRTRRSNAITLRAFTNVMAPG